MTAPDPWESSEPKFLAAVDLLRRTGVRAIQIRYQDDEAPTVWLVVVEYLVEPDGRVVSGPRMPKRGAALERREAWEVAAGRSPLEAALRLCERVVDGGSCAHCLRPTIFHPGVDAFLGDDTVGGALVDATFCTCQWDPELATFRRSCEGDTP